AGAGLRASDGSGHRLGPADAQRRRHRGRDSPGPRHLVPRPRELQRDLEARSAGRRHRADHGWRLRSMRTELRLKDPTLLRDLCHVGGQWVAADSGETAAVVNPATGDEIGTVPYFRAAETRRAVEAA